MAASASFVSAEEAEESTGPHWVPSLVASLEFFGYEGEAFSRNQVNGPNWDASGNYSQSQMLINVGAEVQSGSGLTGLYGAPRPFLGAGIGVPTSSSDEFLVVGDPVNTAFPEQYIELYQSNWEGPNPCFSKVVGCPLPFDLSLEKGQGSALLVTLDTPTWYAQMGAGFLFPLQEGKTALELRPSVEYRGQRVKVQGVMTTVVMDPDSANFDPFAVAPPVFSVYKSRPAAQFLTEHYLGPGLEAVLWFSQNTKGASVAAFAHASYLWLVNGEDLVFADANGWSEYGLSASSGQMRGRVGMRISWGR